MPGFTCCVPGCYNNSHRDRELRFYTFPKDSAQREVWLKNISRAGVSGCFSTFQPTTGHRVCSIHFPGGRKTYSIRVPTLFPLRGVNEKSSRRGRGRKVSLVSLETETPPLASQGDPEPQLQHHFTVSQQEGEGDSEVVSVVLAEPRAQILPSNTTTIITPVLSPATLGALDHPYALGTGTTAGELLKKLNEQRDIIALMEVKMKEMKATIRELRVSEARLLEEVRERDRLLSAQVRKKSV